VSSNSKSSQLSAVRAAQKLFEQTSDNTFWPPVANLFIAKAADLLKTLQTPDNIWRCLKFISRVISEIRGNDGYSGMDQNVRVLLDLWNRNCVDDLVKEAIVGTLVAIIKELSPAAPDSLLTLSSQIINDAIRWRYIDEPPHISEFIWESCCVLWVTVLSCVNEVQISIVCQLFEDLNMYMTKASAEPQECLLSVLKAYAALIITLGMQRNSCGAGSTLFNLQQYIPLFVNSIKNSLAAAEPDELTKTSALQLLLIIVCFGSSDSLSPAISDIFAPVVCHFSNLAAIQDTQLGQIPFIGDRPASLGPLAILIAGLGVHHPQILLSSLNVRDPSILALRLLQCYRFCRDDIDKCGLLSTAIDLLSFAAIHGVSTAYLVNELQLCFSEILRYRNRPGAQNRFRRAEHLGSLKVSSVMSQCLVPAQVASRESSTRCFSPRSEQMELGCLKRSFKKFAEYLATISSLSPVGAVSVQAIPDDLKLALSTSMN